LYNRTITIPYTHEKKPKKLKPRKQGHTEVCKGFFAYNFSNVLNRFGQPLGLTKDRLEEHSPAHWAPKKK